jgi:ribonucleoside-diphosphate reductase alpha chain
MKRRILPEERKAQTRKIVLYYQDRVMNEAHPVSFYLHTGEYPDGSLGEIGLTIGKGHNGTGNLKGMARALAQAVSIGLQYGIPVQEFVQTFRFMDFEPAGWVDGHHYASVVDYLAQWLEERYGNQKQV